MLMVALCVRNVDANTEPDVILYQANDTVYFVTADLLEKLKEDAKDTCLEHVLSEHNEGDTKTTIVKMYELLLAQCRQQIATMSGKLKDNSNWLELDTIGQEFYMSDDKLSAYLAGLKNRNLGRNVNTENVIEKYNLCVITKQDLQARLNKYIENQPKYSYALSADIDACINAINIANVSEDVCPLSPTVESEAEISSLRNLNGDYQNKMFTFETFADVNPRQILVFDGKMLVACDGGIPVHIVRPSFSGYVECRDAQYQSYPGVGVVPDGVYLIKKSNIEPMQNQLSWGKYRIPLQPAFETNTYGRANFYFHGTSDPDKRRSGGCISLGVHIEDFIESDWFRNNAHDLMIVVKTH